MENISARISRLRLARGLKAEDIAKKLDISIHTYHDLESYDDELTSVLTLEEAFTLASLLQTTLKELILGEKGKETHQEKNFPQLVEEINLYMSQNNFTLDQLEDNSGWNLTEFMDNPNTAWDKPIFFLQDIAKSINTNWENYIPRE